jgi:RNA polymerase sigma factor (sigma-70 family)
VRGKPFETWDEFFTGCAEKLYRFAHYLSWGVPDFDGEGEMNMILARMKINWNTIDHAKAVGYARHALTNALSSHTRRNRPRMIPLQQTSQDGEVFSVDLPDSAPTPEESTTSGDLLRRVLEVVHQLPPKDKEVLVLAYAGHTPTEIADLLDEKPVTIRQRLRRARERFHHTCDGELRRTLTQKVTKEVR